MATDTTTTSDTPERDPLDPHVNPAADHLTAHASVSAVEAAAKNLKRVKEATGADIDAPEEYPSVASAVQGSFENSGVDGKAALPKATDTERAYPDHPNVGPEGQPVSYKASKDEVAPSVRSATTENKENTN